MGTSSGDLHPSGGTGGYIHDGRRGDYNSLSQGGSLCRQPIYHRSGEKRRAGMEERAFQ